MARLARLVIPGLPYHVTQRGNRRGTTFFEDDDFIAYRELLAEAAGAAGTRIWSYCLGLRWDYGDSLLNTSNSSPAAHQGNFPVLQPFNYGSVPEWLRSCIAGQRQ